jgi:hypothetical protein
MSRQLRNDNTGSTFDVYAWAMTRNAWEYYILTAPKSQPQNIVEAIVYGDETERGDISIDEIRPYVTTFTYDLCDLAPPPNHSWVE